MSRRSCFLQLLVSIYYLDTISEYFGPRSIVERKFQAIFKRMWRVQARFEPNRKSWINFNWIIFCTWKFHCVFIWLTETFQKFLSKPEDMTSLSYVQVLPGTLPWVIPRRSKLDWLMFFTLKDQLTSFHLRGQQQLFPTTKLLKVETFTVGLQ